MQADEVKSWCVSDQACLVARHRVFIEDREIDPGKACFIACTPDDVLHVEGATIFQDGLTIAHFSDAGRALDTGRSHVARFDTNQWSSTVEQLGPELAPNRGAHGENPVEQHSENQAREKETAEKPAHAKWNLARAASSHVHVSALGEASIASSEPELPAPTSSTGPGSSWLGAL